MSACFFESLTWLCDRDTDKILSTAGSARIKTIIECSKLRGDGLHQQLEEEVLHNVDNTIQCHRNCVSTYTSKNHIKRYLSKAAGQSESSTSNAPPPKRTCRSMMPAFNFRTHYFFCGDKCQLKPDPRRPDR